MPGHSNRRRLPSGEYPSGEHAADDADLALAERGLEHDLDDDEADQSDESDGAGEQLDDDLQPAERKPRRPRGLALVLALGATAGALTLATRCETAPPAGPSLTVAPAPDSEPSKPRPESQAKRKAKPAQTTTPHGDPYRPPAPWVKRVDPPKQVKYVVRSGGSLKNVANRYMLHHHEIIALNPKLDPDADLRPGTEVLVYEREDGEESRSVGYPNDGRLEGGYPMLPGPGRELKALPYKAWGTVRTIMLLDQMLRRWHDANPNGQPILVGNISSRHGGRLRPHGTHQSGRDVDLGYLQKLEQGEELTWRMMNAANLDVGKTWELLFLLAETGALELIYIDRGIQQLLYEHALEKQLLTKAELAKWMEYPRGTGETKALIVHSAGHADHIHVRFACPKDDSDCHEVER